MHRIDACGADRLALEVLVPAELDLLSRHGRVSEVGGELGVKADARLGADDHVGDTDAAERRRRVRGSPRPLVLDRHPPVDFEALGHERLHLRGDEGRHGRPIQTVCIQTGRTLTGRPRVGAA
jgi:hypothetical protein